MKQMKIKKNVKKKHLKIRGKGQQHNIEVIINWNIKKKQKSWRLMIFKPVLNKV